MLTVTKSPYLPLVQSPARNHLVDEAYVHFLYFLRAGIGLRAYKQLAETKQPWLSADCKDFSILQEQEVGPPVWRLAKYQHWLRESRRWRSTRRIPGTAIPDDGGQAECHPLRRILDGRTLAVLMFKDIPQAENVTGNTLAEGGSRTANMTQHLVQTLFKWSMEQQQAQGGGDPDLPGPGWTFQIPIINLWPCIKHLKWLIWLILWWMLIFLEGSSAAHLSHLLCESRSSHPWSTLAGLRALPAARDGLDCPGSRPPATGGQTQGCGWPSEADVGAPGELQASNKTNGYCIFANGCPVIILCGGRSKEGQTGLTRAVSDWDCVHAPFPGDHDWTACEQAFGVQQVIAHVQLKNVWE